MEGDDILKPISDQQLQARLGSGSKSRLKGYRKALVSDHDNRNYDSNLAAELEKYIFRKNEYLKVKKYLRNLRSSTDGKLFSQGVKAYSLMKVALQRFSEDNYTSFRWNRNYQSAKEILIKEFSQLKLKPLVYNNDADIIDALPKRDTHAGFTYIITGNRKKGDNLESVYQSYLFEENEARRNKSFNKPMLIGCRTQGSGAFNDDGSFTYDCKHKTRVVAMVDMFQIIGEMKFAIPFQKAIADMDWYAGGKDPHGIGRIISDMRYNFQYYISLDYSHFDQSISNWLIRDAFEIVASSFISMDEELYSIIVDDFINKNFVSGDGIVHSQKGVPSGSMFTQIIDSVVNRLMITTYFQSIKESVQMIVMGDDNLLYTNYPVVVSEIASYLTKNFGVVVNPDKTSYGETLDDPEFLSREWRFNGQWREPNTVISKMLYPERYRDYFSKKSKVDAKLILFSYILTYSLSLEYLIDVPRFLSDNPQLKRSMVEELVDSRYIPGAFAYIAEYT